jgi:hypothetical protein
MPGHDCVMERVATGSIGGQWPRDSAVAGRGGQGGNGRAWVAVGEGVAQILIQNRERERGDTLYEGCGPNEGKSSLLSAASLFLVPRTLAAKNNALFSAPIPSR